MMNIIFLRNTPDLFYKIFILIKLYNCILIKRNNRQFREWQSLVWKEMLPIERDYRIQSDCNISKVFKLDGIGPVDNRPSTKKLHHFVKKKWGWGGKGNRSLQTSDMEKKTGSVLAHFVLLPQRANSGYLLSICKDLQNACNFLIGGSFCQKVSFKSV